MYPLSFSLVEFFSLLDPLLNGLTNFYMYFGCSILILFSLKFTISSFWTAYRIQRTEPLSTAVLEKVGPPHEVEGVARTHKQQVTAPFSGTKCLAYEYEVQKEISDAFTTIDRGSEGVPFFVEDDAGKVLVDPSDADIRFNNDYAIRLSAGEDVSPETRERIESKRRTIRPDVSSVGGKKHRLVEHRLHNDDDSYIFGRAGQTVNESGDVKAKISGEDVSTFIVGQGSQQDIVQGAKLTGAFFLFAACFFGYSLLVLSGWLPTLKPSGNMFKAIRIAVIVIVCTLGSFATLVYGGFHLRKLYYILSRNIISMDSLPNSDLAGVEGTAKAYKRTLTSPFTGTECLAYQYKIEEKHAESNGPYWKTVDEGQKMVQFRLVDGRESVLVKHVRSNLQLADEPPTQVRGDKKPPERINQFTERHGEADSEERSANCEQNVGRDRRYTESRIDLNESVYIFGQVVQEAEINHDGNHTSAVFRYDDATAMYLISNNSRQQIVRQILWKAVPSTALGLLLLSIFIFLLFVVW